MPPYFRCAAAATSLVKALTSSRRWISYVSALPYGFEALMANEFSARTMQCDPSTQAPSGPTAVAGFAGCAFRGSTPNSLEVAGAAYLEAGFGYRYSHVWRNFGFILAFTIAYIGKPRGAMRRRRPLTLSRAAFAALASEILPYASNGGGATVYARTKRAKQVAEAADEPNDVEKNDDGLKGAENAKITDHVDGLDSARATFTWEHVSYSAQTPAGPRKLLDDVAGYVRPGTTTALMGASGAGKTTLLNTLNRRMPPPMVEGEMLFDGQDPGPVTFKRSCGYAEQFDLHDSSATVREAFEFSALLRQPSHVPRSEKLAYVDTIIKLLELEDFEDAIIGEPGAGLSVEKRKRVTIGVELVAKPSLLMCVRFITVASRGLTNDQVPRRAHVRSRQRGRVADWPAAAPPRQLGPSCSLCVFHGPRLGQRPQADLVRPATIHQPSSVLFTTFFDNVLLLDHGGRTVFFGPVPSVVPYFAEHGVRCGEETNIAEFLLETAGKPAPSGEKWPDVWQKSPQAQVRDGRCGQGRRLTQTEGGPRRHFKDQGRRQGPVELAALRHRIRRVEMGADPSADDPNGA